MTTLKIHARVLRGAQLASDKNNVRLEFTGPTLAANGFVYGSNRHVLFRAMNTINPPPPNNYTLTRLPAVPARASIAVVALLPTHKADVVYYSAAEKEIKREQVDIHQSPDWWTNFNNVLNGDFQPVAIDTVGIDAKYLKLAGDIMQCPVRLTFTDIMENSPLAKPITFAGMKESTSPWDYDDEARLFIAACRL